MFVISLIIKCVDLGQNVPYFRGDCDCFFEFDSVVESQW